jgi:hypothetical protein
VIGASVPCGFMAGAPEAGTPSWVRKIPSSPIEELTPNQSALALTDRTGAQQNCMSLIPKTKGVPESGFGISRNIFMLNDMAERVGFECSLQRSFYNIETTAGIAKAMEDSGRQC